MSHNVDQNIHIRICTNSTHLKNMYKVTEAKWVYTYFH